MHVVGLVSIFLSSKFEDVIPIHMHQVIEDAGHKKFKLEDILAMETDILKTLSFTIQSSNIYDKAFTLLK